MMNKKIRNFIIYAIFLLIVAGCTLTPWFGLEFLWKSENNKEFILILQLTSTILKSEDLKITQVEKI